MFGRRSKSAVMERHVSDASGTVADLAEKAVSAAKEAQRAARPVLRSAAHNSAETLGHAAEKAAAALADTAEKLAAASNSDAALSARFKFADASEALAAKVRPKKKHRIRKLFVVSAILGGIYVLLSKTPLKHKIADLAFGPPVEDEEEPEPITLPTTPLSTARQTTTTEAAADSTTAPESGADAKTSAGGGDNGVATGSSGKGDHKA